MPVGEPDSRQQRSRMAREAKKAKLQLARVQKELGRRLAEEAEKLQAAENECENLRSQLKEANCEAEQRQRQFERENELDVLKARETVRADLEMKFQSELDTRDELVKMLRARVLELEMWTAEEPEGVTESTPSTRDGPPLESIASSDKEEVPRKPTLPSLAKFTGDEKEVGAFERWTRKLLRHAEIEKWNDRVKLLQLELHLAGRAEQVYEMLSEEERSTFEGAVEALTKRLQPVQSEALLSAQLLKRKQRSSEKVEEYTRAFEELFESSYGKRAGMDQASKEMLKRDLFVQGLLLKWQEKVVPSALTFADALHQARLAEDQDQQLSELHQGRPQEPKKPTEKPHSQGERRDAPARGEDSRDQRGLARGSGPRCFKCGSRGHKLATCPQRGRPREAPGREQATSSAITVAPGETLEDRSRRLQEELVDVEYQRMAQAYAGVDSVTGAVGPLYYAEVTIESTPVEAMIDTGSSATILSFALFKRIGKAAKISAQELLRPDIVLRDYNQRPIPVGAKIELTFRWKDRAVTTPVYIQSDLAAGEPCLLGTNVVGPLELMKKDTGVQERERAPRDVTLKEAAVRLVGVSRVPARCAMIAPAVVQSKHLPENPLLFAPDPQLVARTGLQMEDAMLAPDGEGQVLLLIQNPTSVAVKLDPETVMGDVEEISEVTQMPADEVAVRMVSSDAYDGPRLEKLMQAIKICHHLSDHEAKLIRACVEHAADVFAVEKEMGKVSDVSHQIDTGTSPPVRQAPRRTPFSLRLEITQMINEMLETHVIQESNSPWASPVVLVRKKSGEMRFCVDYRQLNAITRKDVYPLPRIDDLLDQLSGKKIFSTLDARAGYWQIAVHEASQEKTAFVTMDGLYEFHVMPFGLCNTPATFQRLMQKILAGLGGSNPFCSVYIDDIIVYSDSVEEHLDHLTQIFGRLRRSGLKLHPQKCCLGFSEVAYLGHTISAHGISPNPEKVRAVQEFQVPSNVKKVREFLGIAGYYRRFIPCFAKVAGPLHALLRQDIPFIWTPQCQSAFDRLKELLVTHPVLAYPCFAKPFVLHTDASGQGLGAVLEQEQEDGQLHPVAYASRTLSPAESRYGITELEALALVWAAKYFRAYLLGQHCIVYTDHAPLQAMFRAKHSSGKWARWAGVVAELDLEIRYRPGRVNLNADALSRSPIDRQDKFEIPVEVMEVTTDQGLAEAQERDPQLKHIQDYLMNDILPVEPDLARQVLAEQEQFMVKDNILYYVDPGPQRKLRIAVPQGMKEPLLTEIHSGPFGGHFAARGLYNTLCQHYWWRNMYRDALHHYRSCLTCAAYQGTGCRVKSPLQPIPVGSPFEKIGVDILEMPQTMQGNRYLIVFMEYLTKWVEAYPAEDQTSETVARILIDNIVCRHGVPGQLLSDRGPNLLSKLIQDICDLLGVKKINTTAYHPQTDGLVERMNKTLRAMIAKHAHTYGPEWDIYLQQLLFAYRVKPQDSTGDSPFYLLYGRDARLPTETAISQPRSPYQEDLENYHVSLATSLTEAWSNAKQHLKRAQQEQKKQYNKRTREAKLKVGDRVMVYMPAQVTGKRRKLALPYQGPFRVLDVTTTGVSVRPVDRPEQEPILVNKDRVTKCPPELPEVSWRGRKKYARSQPKRRDDVTAPQKERRPHPYHLRSKDSPEDM